MTTICLFICSFNQSLSQPHSAPAVVPGPGLSTEGEGWVISPLPICQAPGLAGCPVTTSILGP